MKYLLNILSISLAVNIAQACQVNCTAYCVYQNIDSSVMLTLRSSGAITDLNLNFNETKYQFSFMHWGECKYKIPCNKAKTTKFCAIPEPLGYGYPYTFSNFCELNEYNCKNTRNEYIYYHDDTCNNLYTAIASPTECESLNCDNEQFNPVCTYPKEPKLARPGTFNNYCWLKRYNCELPYQEYLYWHDNKCLSDVDSKM